MAAEAQHVMYRTCETVYHDIEDEHERYRKIRTNKSDGSKSFRFEHFDDDGSLIKGRGDSVRICIALTSCAPTYSRATR